VYCHNDLATLVNHENPVNKLPDDGDFRKWM
jgi:hypothetical protein